MGYGISLDYNVNGKKTAEEKAAIFGQLISASDWETKVKAMRDHPNYLLPTPLDGETQIEFALRCASHIVSPPQFEGESYDVECTTLRDGILSLVDEVTAQWNKSKL